MTDAPAPCPQEWIDLAHRLADIARPIARQYFRTPLSIIAKQDDSPVTIADRSIEAAMREEIEKTFPGHGILGEEHGSVRLDAEAVWVLDPIDGTKAFVTGMPSFGTLIACCVAGRPVLGIIDQPIQEERWLGAAGRVSTYNGAEIAVAGRETLAESVLYATGPEMFVGTPEEARFARLRDAMRFTRYSGDCYAYGLLAAGHVDLVVEAQLQPYDYCALAPVIEGAGGTITDWDGKPLSIESDGRVVAAGSTALHRAALECLSA
ncbi:histidinol-phosphatase [Pacificispira sp.]|uniref:histidinol-phosphatase n=1 Tax=Pacificispira sp. TaxID=2888761 RepID=UPI003BA9F907